MRALSPLLLLLSLLSADGRLLDSVTRAEAQEALLPDTSKPDTSKPGTSKTDSGTGSKDAESKDTESKNAGPLISVDFQETALSQVLLEVSQKSGFNFLTGVGAGPEKVTVKLTKVPALDAAKVIAKLVQCRLVQVTPRVIEVEAVPNVEVNAIERPLPGLLNLLARSAGDRIYVASDVQGPITAQLRSMPWERAFLSVCRTSKLKAYHKNGWTIVRRQSLKGWPTFQQRRELRKPAIDAGLEPELGQTYYKVHYQGKSLQEICKELGPRLGLKLLVDRRFDERVHLRVVHAIPAQELLALLAHKARCRVERLESGQLFFSRPGQSSKIALFGGSGRLILRFLAQFAGKSVVIGPRLKGSWRGSFQGVHPRDLVRVMSECEGFQFKDQGDLWEFSEGRSQTKKQVAMARGPRLKVPTRAGGTLDLEVEAVASTSHSFADKSPKKLLALSGQILKIGDVMTGDLARSIQGPVKLLALNETALQLKVGQRELTVSLQAKK